MLRNQAIGGLILALFLNAGCTARNQAASPIQERIGSDDYRYYMLSPTMSTNIKHGIVEFTETDARDCKELGLTPTMAASLYSTHLPGLSSKRTHNCRMIAKCATTYKEHGFLLNTLDMFESLHFSVQKFHDLCSEKTTDGLASRIKDEHSKFTKRASDIKVAQVILDNQKHEVASFYYSSYVKIMTAPHKKGDFETTSDFKKRLSSEVAAKVGYGPHVVKTGYIAKYDADIQGWGFEPVNATPSIDIIDEMSGIGPCSQAEDLLGVSHGISPSSRLLPVGTKTEYRRDKTFLDAWGKKVYGLESLYSRVFLYDLDGFLGSVACKNHKLYMPIGDAKKMGVKPIDVYMYFNVSHDGEFLNDTSYTEPTIDVPIESTVEYFFIPGKDIVILFVRDGKILHSF